MEYLGKRLKLEKYEAKIDAVAAQLTKNGWKYTKGYLQNGGKDLSIAYLKDLGYDDSDAKLFYRKTDEKWHDSWRCLNKRGK